MIGNVNNLQEVYIQGDWNVTLYFQILLIYFLTIFFTIFTILA